MFPKLIEMHKMKIIHLFGDYTKLKMLSTVDGHGYSIRQIHYEKRKDLLLTAQLAKCLKTGKGRWRVTAGPPQESGETGALSWCLRGHTPTKASNIDLDAGHLTGFLESVEMTQGVQNHKQHRASEQTGERQLTLGPGLGWATQDEHRMVSQNPRTSLLFLRGSKQW